MKKIGSSILDNIHTKVEFVDFIPSKLVVKNKRWFYNDCKIVCLILFLEDTADRLKNNISYHKCKLLVDSLNPISGELETKRLYLLLPQNLIFEIISSIE